MGIPAIISSVPASTPYIQYVATSGQTVFPFPFVITQDSDLIAVYNGNTLATDQGYSLSGVGNSNGGDLTFNSGATSGDIITLYRDIPIERLTQIGQNSGFSSTAFNAEFNNLYLIAQQLQESINQCLQIPITNTQSGGGNILTPTAYSGKYLSFDSNGNPTPALLTSSGTLTAGIIGSLIYPKSEAENSGGFNPTQLQYVYGCPRRFGAAGVVSLTDDTAAVQAAMNSSGVYFAYPNDEYSVSTVVAGQSLAEVHWNGSELIGNAQSAANCVMQIQTNFCTWYGSVAVNGGSYNGINPNSNYTCLVWWYRAGGASQFNTIYGMELFNANRGVVYGGLPGNSSTTIVHSENKLYNFQSTGVANPMYMNSSTGFLHCYGSTFFRDASSWTSGTLPSTARAYEVLVGNLYIHGGEVIASNSLVGYACDGPAIVDGTYFEISAPIHMTLDNGRFSNCRINLLNQGVNMVVIDAAATGVLAFSDCTMLRPAGTGATDRSPMVDGTASPTFSVELNDCDSFEWGFGMAGQNCKLIQGCVARYSNHRLSITAADSNVYRLNTPRVSLLPQANAAVSTAGQPLGAVDPLGYTTDGWVLNAISGSGTTLTNTTNTGPSGYLSSQLTLHATGQAFAVNGDSTSLSTLKTSALRVRPSEVFWLSSWMNASGTNPNLVASFYDITGAAVSTTKVADTTGIGSGVWTFAEGPLPVPASSAYMLVGVEGIATDIQFTDFRLQRA